MNAQYAAFFLSLAKKVIMFVITSYSNNKHHSHVLIEMRRLKNIFGVFTLQLLCTAKIRDNAFSECHIIYSVISYAD